MTPAYPDDADGDALRRVASSGSDMALPMVIDFPRANRLSQYRLDQVP